MVAVSVVESVEQPTREEVITLQSRKTDELVVALVGPVGSGVSTTSEELIKVLEKDFGYGHHYIKVSDIIRSFAGVVGEDAPEEDDDESERIKKLQKIGNKMRDSFGEGYVAEKCVERIAVHRHQNDGYKSVGGKLVSRPRRVIHVIDSLKNPAEVDLLRDVYGEIFWVFGVFAPEEVRRSRLVKDGVKLSTITSIFEIDEDEGVSSGQKVRDTIEKSDFFIRNDDVNREKLEKSIRRFLDIIFGAKVNTPTRDEIAMYTAASAATSSACLSRQVGAAIYTKEGELIGKGANDVPKPKGGQYCWEDQGNDHRCHKWEGRICHNDDRKELLYKDITKKLKGAGIVGRDTEYDAIKKVLKKTDIKNLIEYSRAVHAEMEAIMSVVRGAKHGIVGSTLYCTTFPCHNCARHIVASGISRVVYIEPYPKSLATVLHSDAISLQEGDAKGRVEFLQYEGVAPRNMLRLFSQGAARKEGGKAIEREPTDASPVSRSPLDGFHRREQIVVHRLQRAEAETAEKTEGAGHDEAQG
ncbi:anti-phage dCTP deaminase [Azospirillum tabaci]|uniref:anti-phage dCTP deaminase n=1 Tax=Azospirillum tabaci TaxID=2752310 RepID=UPI00166053F0|nr:anti-phage dCTP deaminase [Azospirillum tabaci]